MPTQAPFDWRFAASKASGRVVATKTAPRRPATPTATMSTLLTTPGIDMIW